MADHDAIFHNVEIGGDLSIEGNITINGDSIINLPSTNLVDENHQNYFLMCNGEGQKIIIGLII